MTDTVHIEVADRPLDAAAALAFCSAPGHGAADLFAGRVRNLNLGRAVRAVSYDLHASLTRRSFEAICAEAQERWGDTLRLWLAHRYGRLGVGDISVVAAASSPHRHESFLACRYLVEEMKRRAPIWKQEHYVDGDSDWVRGHALCGHG